MLLPNVRYEWPYTETFNQEVPDRIDPSANHKWSATFLLVLLMLLLLLLLGNARFLFLGYSALRGLRFAAAAADDNVAGRTDVAVDGVFVRVAAGL